MQVLDETKRKRILEAASELIRMHPYHEVRMSDVAAAASVSKGALYLYFKDKQDLFESVVYRGFSTLPDSFRTKLEALAPEASPRIGIELIIGELVHHASTYVPLLEIMHSVPGFESRMGGWIRGKMGEVVLMIESIIRLGNTNGEFDDPAPEITAHLIPGMAASYFFGHVDIDMDASIKHMQRLIISAISRREGIS
jgi:AcrR family transcriptional regulator